MIVVEEKQFSEKIIAATRLVGDELSEYKGKMLSPREILWVIVPNSSGVVLKELRWRIFIAGLFTLIIFAAFYLTVNTMLRQKKLSEIKNDFINNMTHEFKTPLATISLAVDAMKNDKVIGDKEKLNYFSSIIKEENQRMNRQVETILKAALLDRQDVNLMLKPTHVHDVIKMVDENGEHIKVNSMPGKGRTFTLKFQLKKNKGFFNNNLPFQNSGNEN